MKHLKTYNESIRHLLKPKSKDDILKSLKDEYRDDDLLLKSAEYGVLDLLSEEEILNVLSTYPDNTQYLILIGFGLYKISEKFKDEIDYFHTNSSFFREVITKKEILSFDKSEIKIIENFLVNKPLEYYNFNEETLYKNGYHSLYIVYNNNGLIINNYKYFITVQTKKVYQDAWVGYYICPTFDEFLKFLNNHLKK